MSKAREKIYASKTAVGDRRAPAPARGGGGTHPALALQGTVGNRGALRFVQTKLAVSRPGDPAEREADRIAERVAAGTLSAKCECSGTSPCECPEEKQQPAAVSRKADAQAGGASVPAGAIPSGGGRALDAGPRAFMERSFGRDFGRVRVHTDAASAGASSALRALAFTTGTDIYFGAGQYRPETTDGRRLLAHELVHVVQQQPGVVARQDEESAGMTSPDAPASVAAPAPNQTDATAALTGLARIREIHKNWWVGPNDESELERIWAGFGSQLPAIATTESALFHESIGYGAELGNVAPVRELKARFAQDVKSTAKAHLLLNRDFIAGEMDDLGLNDTAAVPAGPQTEDPVAKLQEGARLLADAKRADATIMGTQVGYEYDLIDGPGRTTRSTKVASYFSPGGPPPMRPRGDETPPLPVWDNLKKTYDDNQKVITGLLNRHPTLFAVQGGSELGEVGAGSAQQARTVMTTALQKLLTNIDETAPKIDNGDLHYWDMKSIHQQLFAGGGPSGTAWNEAFYKWAAEDDLSDRQGDETLIALALGGIGMVALIAASVATFGTAAFFVAAGVGLGAGAIQAGRSWENWQDLNQASQTALTPGDELITSGQANEALFGAILDTVFLALDAYGVVAQGVRATRTVAQGAEHLGETTAREAAEREVREQTAKQLAEQAERNPARALAEAALKEGEELTERELALELRTAQRGAARALEGAGEYVLEVAVPGSRHVWRRTARGNWCRFSSKFCLIGVEQLSSELRQVVEEAEALRLAQPGAAAARTGDRAIDGVVAAMIRGDRRTLSPNTWARTAGQAAGKADDAAARRAFAEAGLFNPSGKVPFGPVANHAEGGAMLVSYRQGARGPEGTLVVLGDMCGFCNRGGVANIARGSGLTKLEVLEVMASGQVRKHVFEF